MTDRELLARIIKQCKCKYLYTLDVFINEYVEFNDQDQCTHLNLALEELVEIPDELLALKHLEQLDLSCNKLTFIPDELNYIKDLYTDGNLLLESNDKVEILFNKGILNDR